ncbi:MAG TPA: TetR/AcrR family transcriptional regulator, partial [Pseudogracilibacillus sp.]|nr:TetR/AcrR family transcriptional regulator [Pseudogracilibacillus sp.]
MPKQTFFNLPEEKRDTLIHAAKNEFSRVSLYEASIANIVKEAEIPRGSFYQYFEDKDDLYFYLLDKQGEELWKTLITNLKEHQGDLFKSL